MGKGDHHKDAPANYLFRFEVSNYEVSTVEWTDEEIWEKTPPKRRYLLPPDFAERFDRSKPDQ
ncbi:hypothetical protein [Pseudaestuariivita rosea]|uniref:hypothetical protein n=1 Tax=Pseudaestuariivita rosea TaxID=2763263 RepID=UPI001ABA46AA|nr:hypothetical protein [Pseudaestuariivita rosea]